MKAHKITLLVLNFENTSEEDLRTLIEHNKYLSVSVEEVETVELGEWDDDHPLNKKGRDWKSYFKKDSHEA